MAPISARLEAVSGHTSTSHRARSSFAGLAVFGSRRLSGCVYTIFNNKAPQARTAIAGMVVDEP